MVQNIILKIIIKSSFKYILIKSQVLIESLLIYF